jgi:hypothetical protein
MYLVINKWVIAVKVSNFSGQYLRNHWTLDIGVLGYIGIVGPKEHSPEVRSSPPGTPCIYIYKVVIELSYVDYVLVPVDAGFLVEVIHFGLWGIYYSCICCHLWYVWIVAIRCSVARFIQSSTNYIVISPNLFYCRLRFLSISCAYCIKLSWFILHIAWYICNLQDLLRCQLHTTYRFLYAESFTDVRISRRALGKSVPWACPCPGHVCVMCCCNGWISLGPFFIP